MTTTHTEPTPGGPVRAEGATSLALQPVSWRLPIIYTALTLIAGVFFWIRAENGLHTTFRLRARQEEWISIPDVDVPSRLTAGLLVAVMVVCAVAVILSAVQRRKPSIWLAVPFGVSFVLAFLVWIGAGSDSRITLTTLLSGGLALSVPLIFGAMCGILGERAGVVNIAIEGQLLGGAFMAAVVASATGFIYAGLIAAPIAGLLVAALLALFAVRYWVDQIIVGVVLNVLVLGLTGFFFSTVLSNNRDTLNRAFRLPELPIPLLSEIPVIGPVLFRQSLLVYLMYVIVIALHVLLFRSRWGLRLRAVGEHPKAADTVGINVNRTRVRNVLLGGAIAGLGGAFFTIGNGSAFGHNMSAGNGFIALAAMILGRWNPGGALMAALLFGFTRSLGNALQGGGLGAGVPNQLLNALPYIITIIAVAGLVGRVRAPAASNIPYTK